MAAQKEKPGIVRITLIHPLGAVNVSTSTEEGGTGVHRAVLYRLRLV